MSRNTNIDVQILERISKNRIDTYVRKNNDYGNSVEKGFEEFGDLSLLVRITDKVERLKSLLKGNQQMVNDESIDDTILDLGCYADIWAMLRHKHYSQLIEDTTDPYSIKEQEINNQPRQGRI